MKSVLIFCFVVLWTHNAGSFELISVQTIDFKVVGGVEIESDVMVDEEDYDGMMEALTNIQEKGDNMMAGIWWQKDILDKLETSLEEAENKMVAAEERNEALDNIKEDLETEVSNLEKRREELIVRMSEEEQHMQR